MKIKSLGIKVSLIVAIMIAIILVVIILIVSNQSGNLVTNLASREAVSANSAFAREIVNLQEDSATRANIIANSGEIIDAILSGDEAALQHSLMELGEGMDVVTLCDKDGNVLMRTQNDKKGDNVLNQKALATALSTGTGISTIEAGTTTGLATRSSAAIKDDNGNIIAAVTVGHDLSNSQYVDEVKASTNCEATFFNGDTRMSTTLIDENGNRVVGTKASDAVIEAVINQKKNYQVQIVLFGNNYFAYYSPLIVDGNVIGMLFTGVPINDVLAGQRNMMNLVLWIGIICGLACIALIFIFNIFSVSRPLKKISVFAEKIKTGDLGVSTTVVSTIGVRSSDEVGILAKSLEQAYIYLRGYVGEIKERMQGLADGDLTTESTYDFQGDFVLIKDSINDIVSNLNRIMTGVQNASTQVYSGAKQVADGSQTLAQGSTEQASAVQQLSSSVADIAQKTKINADMAGKAAKLADTIRGNAEKGSQQMNEMIIAVNEINKSSQNISKVIKVIDDIAFQTNILALNAAVEAARAGQHGKGFAVVAEEVRNLASKSAEAAKDTGVMIQDSMEKAGLGSRIAGETAESLTGIVSGINESTQLVTEIAKSSEEQSAGISQVNIGLDQVAQVVQQNSATAEESAAASEEMSGQSDLLQQLMAQFTLDKNGVVRQNLPSPQKRRVTANEPGSDYSPDTTAGGFGKY